MTVSKLNPLEGRVVIENIPAARVKSTEGGVLTISALNTNQQIGKVLAVGPGRTNRTNGEIQPVPVKAGQRVIFNKATAVELEVDDIKYLMIEGTDIFAIVRDKDETFDEDGKVLNKTIEQLIDRGAVSVTVSPQDVSFMQASPVVWFQPATDADADKDHPAAWFAGIVKMSSEDKRELQVFCPTAK